MHLLFCRSHLYVHKIRTLEVPDGNLPSAEVASHSAVLGGSYYWCQVGVLESVTVRRSEHVRHEEDLKGHLVPFLPDCSLVSADYPFLTLQTVCSYTNMRQPVSYRGITFGYQIGLRCR
jgi:hypothetical protein